MPVGKVMSRIRDTILDTIVQERNSIKFLADGLILISCYYLSFLIRFDFTIPSDQFILFARSLPFAVLVPLGMFFLFDFHNSLWGFWSMRELRNLVLVYALSIVILLTLFVSLWFFVQLPLVPRSIPIIYFMLGIVFLGGLRMAYRLYSERSDTPAHTAKRIIIVGAGQSAEMLLRQIQKDSRLHYRVVGLIDDDTMMIKRKIHGVPILGSRSYIPEAVKSKAVDEILIAVPSATSKQMREIVRQCELSGKPFRTLPGPKELMDGDVVVSKLRKVRIDDLLGREQAIIDETRVRALIEGKRVMVTGAAGSIGSELCRQILAFKPESLTGIDKDENGCFYLGMSLRPIGPFQCIVANAANHRKMEYLFQKHRPQLVFHAAAYKHVPCMEMVPDESVLNNLGVTKTVADLAVKYGVEKFIQISTDKAVEPSNIMGASKRLCELYVRSLSDKGTKGFMSVRFGNVIGSQGSVFTVFEKQIQEGKPITVTHPDMERYFMTIPEACRLVLEAGTQGVGGCTFVLDMGEPIRIADLARHMIVLSGFKPDEDIPIQFTGLRPGEKLEEKLWYDYERPVKSENPRILLTRTNGEMPKQLDVKVDEILALAQDMQIEKMLSKIKEVIPEYNPSEFVSN
jgi:FlaA1/EpsC-like NDP-sugar epimerase